MKAFYERLFWKIYDTPGRIYAKLNSLRIRQYCICAPTVYLSATAKIVNSKEAHAISIGKGSNIHGMLQVFPHGGVIKMGEDCFVGPNTNIWSGRSITIGDRVLISHSVNIFDTNSHSLSANYRSHHFSETLKSGQPATVIDVDDSPVIIGDDVWVGFGSAIMKGVTLGTGCVIAACSVVTKNVDDYMIVAGNPAKIVGKARP